VRDTLVGVEGYRRYFNEERLHSSLGYQTPDEFAASWEAKKEEPNQALTAVPTSSAVTLLADTQESMADTKDADGT